MNHIGGLITPYIDGELGIAQQREIREHLSCCPGCRQQVWRQRQLRNRTRAAAAVGAARPELTARLLTVPQGLPQAPAPSLSWRPPVLVGGGSVALVGIFVFTLFMLGAPAPPVSPAALVAGVDAAPSESFVVNVAAATGIGSEELSGDGGGWSVPAGLVVTSSMRVADADAPTWDLTLRGEAGSVRLLQRFGHLDAAAASPPQQVAGHVAYRLHDWWVLESGSSVIAICGTPQAVAAVVAMLPPPDESATPLDRLRNGWSALVS
ncbi:MAG: anti-sigma factor family protein [Beutenbergiaceae bacterium]